MKDFLLFTLRHCRNCKPVRQMLVNYGVDFDEVDCSIDKNIATVLNYGVSAVPCGS